MEFLFGLDKSLLHYINVVWTHPWLDIFFPAITDLHKHLWFQIAIIPLMLGLFLWKYKKRGFFVFFCLILSMSCSDFVGNRVFKKNIERLRPADALGDAVIVRSPYGGYSFVSNHSANMFSLAKFTADMIPQVRIPFYTAAALVGYSRMYNGVHYPTDVLGGGLLGYLFGWIFSTLCKMGFERFRRRREIS
ncbi:MAG: phosphatase PAP2 family protein [Bdellovibrionaceae bacterium]|nr:phosphatase PAP2 family protein [Pseudobdellovibrionaceae bacterium]